MDYALPQSELQQIGSDLLKFPRFCADRAGFSPILFRVHFEPPEIRIRIVSETTQISTLIY